MNRWKIIRIGVLVLCLYLIVTTIGAIVDLWRAGDKLIRREQELAALTTEHEQLLRRQEQAQSPLFMEHVARDELGMSKPGEKIVVIPEELLNGPVVNLSAKKENWKLWLALLIK